MRVGDVYKIERMLANGSTPKEIHARFANDYPKDEINKFIPTDAFKKEKAADEVAQKAANAEKEASEKKANAEKVAAEKAAEKEAAVKKTNKKDPLA